MPIVTGKSNSMTKISSVYLGNQRISKAYLGTQLVFNSDAVWMLRTYTGWYYSIDGIHYHLLASETGDFSNSFAYSNGKFIWNDSRYPSNPQKNTRLRLYDVALLRNGVLSAIYRQGNKWVDENNVIASDNNGVLASNGLINFDGGDGKAVNYSFDDGVSWSTRKLPNEMKYLAKFIRYIGSGKFFLHVKDTSDEEGCYCYWTRSDPTSWFRCSYTLPDNTVPVRTYLVPIYLGLQ